MRTGWKCRRWPVPCLPEAAAPIPVHTAYVSARPPNGAARYVGRTFRLRRAAADHRGVRYARFVSQAELGEPCWTCSVKNARTRPQESAAAGAS